MKAVVRVIQNKRWGPAGKLGPTSLTLITPPTPPPMRPSCNNLAGIGVLVRLGAGHL